MKTYLADIIPRIQKFSKRLDDLTKLTNQHWVSLGDISESKKVFMFRDNSKLLIAENGIIVDKGTWEYLGNQTLLLETDGGGYLLKHGFFDEYVIALKLDSTDNYAFFVNETKYESELNSIEDILRFLENRYLNNYQPSDNSTVGPNQTTKKFNSYNIRTRQTKDGRTLEIHTTLDAGYTIGDKAYINGSPAPSGKYKIGWMDYLTIENGKIKSL